MSKEARLMIAHGLNCVERINNYTQGNKQAFLADGKTQDAVIRNLEVLGQVVKDVGVDTLHAQAPEIPWRLVANFRNVLAHQYLGVDLNLVWNVIEHELPKLCRALQTIQEREAG